jgi:hypothetical protein
VDLWNEPVNPELFAMFCLGQNAVSRRF